MATGTQEAADSREQACVLCGKVDEDSGILGPMQELNGSYFHAYCADTTCIICMDPVEDSISYGTMVCPCCQHAWFHRACIQEHALSAGIHSFQCPLCRDGDKFIDDMRILGIRIPLRRLLNDSLHRVFSSADGNQPAAAY
ncbi:UNVERIFIED_CONTAM: hypothetical protein H355_003698, partial [Colinus virginianus]